MEAKKFNREIFAVAFAASIEALAQSEQVTKRELQALSRSVLEATHETGDIQFVNKLLTVLSPVNRRVAVVFFRHLTGFSYDENKLEFTKKSKKRYAKAFADYVAFMADPMNNIWSWAARNIEVEHKPFDGAKLTSYIQSKIEQAKEAGKGTTDVLRAVLKAGITLDDVIVCMGEMAEDKATTLNKVADNLGFDVNVKAE